MGGFGGVPPGGGGAPPAGGGGNPPSEFNVMRDLGDSIESSNAAKVLDKIAQGLDTLGLKVETADKKILKFRDNLRGSILIADNTTEALKVMSDQTKELARNFAQNKGLGAAKTAYQGLILNLREMAVRNKENSKLVAGFNRQIANLTAAEQRLSKVTEQYGDKAEEVFKAADGWVEVTKNIAAAAKETTRLGAAVSNLKMGKIGTYVGDTRKALIDAGIMKAGRFEKWTAMGEAGIKLKEAAKAKREANRGDFMGRRDMARAAVEDLEKKGHIKLARSADGGVDWAKMASDRKKMAKAGGAGGTGDLGTTMNLLQQAGAAPKGGLMGKLTGGGGLVESAVGTGAELAGKFALPLAIAEAVKDLIVALIDKNAEMNKQAETLSGGGLLAGAGGPGGKSAADTFLAARSNLMPAYGVSALGLNYDRNIKMAQSVIESGYGIEEIGQGGVFGDKKGDFAPGTFGEVQKMAATTGRVSGMGDASSVQMGMKLLTQYRESMEGMNTFMVNINKDFRMAGLSVAKYVSILEEVTGQFDRMNKSIDQTSGVLRALSMTGRSTAEDLQANMKMILGDPKRDVGMQIFLNSMMKQPGEGGGPSQAAVSAKQQNDIADRQATNAFKALAGPGGLGMDLDKDTVKSMLQQPGGREQLNTMITTFQANHPGVDARKFISAQGALSTAAVETQRAQALDQWSKGKISDVEMQAITTGLGKSPQSQANENLASAKMVMKLAGINPNKLYEEGGAANTQLFEQASTMAGLSPTFLRDQQLQLQQQGQARYKVALSTPEQSEAVFNAFKDKLGPGAELQKKSDGTMETYKEALERWTKEKTAGGFGGKFQALLRGQDEGIEAAYSTNDTLAKGMDDDKLKAEKDRIEEAARSAGRVTQTTADIFANAFSYYFTEVVNVLEKIRLYFAHSKWFGGVSEDMELEGAASVKKDLAKLNQAAADNDLRIADINRQLEGVDPNDTQKKADLEKQLRDEQSKKEALATRTKFGAGSGLSQYDAANLADIARGEIQGGQQPLTDALKEMNDQMDTAGDFVLTPDQYVQQQKMLEASGAKLGGPVTANNDAQGAPVSYTVHITQYSHDTNMQTGTLDDTRKAVETGAPSPTAAQTTVRGRRIPTAPPNG